MKFAMTARRWWLVGAFGVALAIVGVALFVVSRGLGAAGVPGHLWEHKIILRNETLQPICIAPRFIGAAATLLDADGKPTAPPVSVGTARNDFIELQPGEEVLIRARVASSDRLWHDALVEYLVWESTSGRGSAAPFYLGPGDWRCVAKSQEWGPGVTVLGDH